MRYKTIISGLQHGVKLAKRNLAHQFPYCGLHAQSQVYLELTTRCNMKCSYCSLWSKDHSEEAGREQWLSALSDLLDVLGTPKINFAGGEPLVSPFLFDLLQYCTVRGAYPGFVTNGILLNDRNIERLAELNISNINISLDDDRPEVFDVVRNRPGHTKQILTQIVKLRKALDQANCTTKLFLKPVIHAGNCDRLRNLVRLTQDIGCDGIMFQPLCAPFGKTSPPDWFLRDPWWPKAEQLERLKQEIVGVYEQRRNKAPIINSEADILHWSEYFCDPTHFSLHQNDSVCMIGYNNLYLFADGAIRFCPDRKAIGNFKTQSLKSLLTSKQATEEIIRMRNCRGFSCVKNCMTPKSFMQTVKAFILLVRR